MRLHDKVALISGGGSGIGRACALAFAREGARLALLGRRQERLDGVMREIGSEHAMAIPGDVTKPAVIAAALQRVVARFGKLDVLVNNAGLLIPGTAESCTEEDWDRSFAVNARAVWLLSRAVLPHMRQAGGGSIINISSVLGLVAARQRAIYAASKGAVTLLTRCMAVDHAADNIRVNCICPSFIVTELTEGYLSKTADPQAVLRERTAAHPMGRLGRPEDVAGMAVYLASDESSWVTGAALPVDGGYTAI